MMEKVKQQQKPNNVLVIIFINRAVAVITGKTRHVTGD